MTSGSHEGALDAEHLDGIPPEVAARLLRAVNRSPSTWTTLIDADLTTQFISQSANWLQGTDPSGRIGKMSIDRLHPDDRPAVLHALAQLRAAQPEHTPTVPVFEPLRYRIRRLDGSGWMPVESLVLNLMDDPVTHGFMLVSRPAGADVDEVLDLLVDEAPLPEVLAGCARLIPRYLGSAAVVALIDECPTVGAPVDSLAAQLSKDDRWWRKAVAEGREQTPLDFAGYPEDLVEVARGLGFKSAWVLPLTAPAPPHDIIGCVVVWVRIAVEYNIGTDEGLRKTARMARLVIGEQRTHHALRREAATDPLTGVGNRSALQRRLDEAPGEVTVAMIDLDDFKPVNDTYGHDTGDAVLAVVAERVLAAVREEDLVVRLGGDEFAIIFADGASPEGVDRSARRISESVGQPIQLEQDVRVAVGASIGLATGRPDEVLHLADTALYQAKRGRR